MCEHHYCLSATFDRHPGSVVYKCCKCLTGDATYQIWLAEENAQYTT